MILGLHGRAAAKLLCLMTALALPQLVYAAETPWWVSLGVYRGVGAAQRALEALPADAVPAGSQARVVQIEKGGTVFHRVVAGPFASRAEVDNALPAWRVKVQGAFPLMLAVEDAVAAPAVVDAAPQLAKLTMAQAVTQPDAVEPKAAANADTDAPAIGMQQEARLDVPVVASSNQGATPQEAASAAQPRATHQAVDGLGLDTATERLLRDDRALQRELERLSRGLPKGLSAEIDAARAEGVSLRELKLRSPSGPQSPTQVPDGYQLHRLHREPLPTDAVLTTPPRLPAENDWWRFLQCAA